MRTDVVKGIILCVAAMLLTPTAAWAQEGAPAPEAAPDASVTAEEPAAPEAPPGEGVDPRQVGLAPTPQGVTGLFHTTSAQTSEDLTFRFGLFMQVFSGSDVVRANDEDSRFIGTLALSATPLPWLEPYLVLGARSNSNTFSTPQTVLAQGDTSLGAKAVYGVAPAFSVGGELRLDFLTGAGDTSFDFGATSVKLAALGTFDGQALPRPLPLKAHLNVGYYVDNSDQLLPEDEDGLKIPPDRVTRFAQGLSAYDQVQVGLGVEAPLPYVTASLEYTLGIWSGQEPAALCGDDAALPCPSQAGFGANPQVVTLGVKGAPLEGLVLNAALDLGLSTEDVSGAPATAPWNLILGLAYVFDPRPKIVEIERVVTQKEVVQVAPKEAWLAGTVVDLDTADPVPGATLSWEGTSLTRQATGEKDGAFRSYGFEPGAKVTLQISHPNYEAQTVTQTLQEGENLVQVKLKPEGAVGVVSGTIRNADGSPATGTVVLTGPRTYTVNLEGGAFAQKVLAGNYTVAATIAGSLTAGRDVEVKPDGRVEVQATLAARPATSAVTVTENKLLVEGRIEFEKGALKPASEALLDQVAAAILEHPEFKRIRVEAHTDDRVPANKRIEETEAQAKAVRDYLLKRGISAERLEAKGFGADQPLVPNISTRNRDINRRVSFTVVSRRAGE